MQVKTKTKRQDQVAIGEKTHSSKVSTTRNKIRVRANSNPVTIKELNKRGQLLYKRQKLPS